MGKIATSTASKRTPTKRRSVGRTYDGIELMPPSGKPGHFTLTEIRQTIKKLRAEGVISTPGKAAAE